MEPNPLPRQRIMVLVSVFYDTQQAISRVYICFSVGVVLHNGVGMPGRDRSITIGSNEQLKDVLGATLEVWE